MIKINAQLDRLMVKAGEDLRKAPTFLVDVQKSIIRCYEIENEAFIKLHTIITSS